MNIKQYRKTPRAKWLFYNEGKYFVTVCTKNKEHYFGTIRNGEMYFSKIGYILKQELENPTSHHPHIEVIQYVVMPNHFHAIINVGRKCGVNIFNNINEEELMDFSIPQRNPNPSHRFDSKMSQYIPLLSIYMRSLKSSVSRMAHEIDKSFQWQTRYHDHLIRGFVDGKKISDYITNNVGSWDQDCFYKE